MKQHDTTRKLALAGVLTALAVAGSLISFPVAGSKCAPIQHMVNVLSAVLLGPWWGVVIAFCASLIRNLTGLGSLMAFPGSMVGALCCGIVYATCKKTSLTCLAEAFGTGVLGGLAAYPVAKFLMGVNPAGLFVYIVPFLISTVAGSILAFMMVTILEKGGVLRQMQGAR
ncbi:MAG: energy coupling factor transporter S component ThiW [Eubacteriales bacterium]|nr:energy coupling factor transporter S component ThiW [Eubacteriales bacterium]